jgi:hypothetical protein
MCSNNSLKAHISFDEQKYLHFIESRVRLIFALKQQLCVTICFTQNCHILAVIEAYL